jgi:hypothetical protein
MRPWPTRITAPPPSGSGCRRANRFDDERSAQAGGVRGRALMNHWGPETPRPGALLDRPRCVDSQQARPIRGDQVLAYARQGFRRCCQQRTHDRGHRRRRRRTHRVEVHAASRPPWRPCAERVDCARPAPALSRSAEPNRGRGSSGRPPRATKGRRTPGSRSAKVSVPACAIYGTERRSSS